VRVVGCEGSWAHSELQVVGEGSGNRVEVAGEARGAHLEGR